MNRIKLKLWLPLSLGTTLLHCLFLKNQTEYLVMAGVFVATYANLFMLMYTLDRVMLSPEAIESGKRDKFMILLMFAGKMFVLFVALGIGVHFIGNRIIIPLINYVIQIFVLCVSIKRN